jgi:hypothetical protein
METSINYINAKPSLYLPPSSNTEDEGRGSLRDIWNALHIKMSDRRRKIKYIKTDVPASNSTGGNNGSENTVKHTQHIFLSIKLQTSNNVL